MKRGWVLFSVSLILILSLSIISASWFTDLFDKITGKAQITGQTVAGICSGTATACSSLVYNACTSQQGCYRGGTTYQNCFGTATACSSLSEEQTCTSQQGCEWTPTSTTCTDSDNLNIYTAGETKGNLPSGNYVNKSDFCSYGNEAEYSSCSGANCQVYEFMCTTDDETGNTYAEAENYHCSNGCVDGACVGVADTQYTLEEGQKMTIEVGGGLYDVSLIYAFVDGAKFNINGELTNTLSALTTQLLGNGVRIKVYEIVYQSYNGGIYQATFSLSSPPEPTCTDSDGGKNLYEKGSVKYDVNGVVTTTVDECWTDSHVIENYCDEWGYPRDNMFYCTNGCVDGACKEIEYAGTCSDFVNEVANPSDFEDGEVSYSLEWSGAYNDSWWGKFGNETPKDYTEYYASWWFNYKDWEDDKYGYMHESAMVFNDESFEAINVMNDYIQGGLCRVHSYTNYNDENEDDFGQESLFYVCRWNIYNKGLNIDNNDWKHREILWAHDNVLLRMSVGMGVDLSEEEMAQLIEKETTKFLSSLQNNNPTYQGWQEFSLDWPLEDHLFNLLKTCPSDIPETTCRPQWQCITEPTICPEHGYQTQTCKDYGCESPDKVEQISCNPGICSGCLVPKWFSPYSSTIGENRCIPYGFRFESEIGWHEGEQKGSYGVQYSIANAIDEEVNMSISPEGVVILFVEDWGNQEYIFSEGGIVNVNVTDWDESLVSFSFVAKEVVYDAEVYENSYVVFEFTEVYLGRIVDTINAYCDIDGTVQPQKTKEAEGAWARCQNNYECDSNLCSSGECVELGDVAKEATAFKELVVRFFCRITSLLDSSNYDQCLVNNGIASE